MKKLRLIPIVAGAALAAACSTSVQQPATTAPSASVAVLPASNPFASVSTLAFQTPDFSKIKDSDYEPAYNVGMAQQLAEINVIANNPTAPTFDNTIIELEKSGALLTRAAKVFNAITAANINDTLQRVQETLAPKLAAHSDEIYLNGKLFQRVKTLYDARTTLGYDQQQKSLVEYYYRNFVRAGANLSEADKTKLREMNKEESTLITEFQNRLLAGTKEGAVVVDDVKLLDGMDAGDIAAAAEAAKANKLTGKWSLPLQNTTQQPYQSSLRNRSLRERLFKASINRTQKSDSNDTRASIKRLAELRAEKAKLLGFPNYSAYALDNQMAKTPENATRLLTNLVPASVAKAKYEITQMQKLIDAEKGGFKLAPWDYQYYAEQVRKAQFDLDESQIKPYLEINRVLNDGVFYAANKLYGLTFKERKDLPVYHPDVRVWEVFDHDGKPLALFYGDFFKRDAKSGGAWMDNFVDQNGITGTKPVVFNVENFSKPAAGQPALLSFDDVTTLFHEFGHALHGMFSNVKYPSISGTATPRDFVEFPSQFYENWALEPTVFANYAKHYQTGTPMPKELVEKIKNTKTFNQGFGTTEYLAASLLDIAWHTLPPGTPQQEVDAFETQALAKFNIGMPEVPPRYRTSYFRHIWSNGYASSYYAYLWSEVLDHDAYAWFVENGGMTRANGQKFRDMVLSRGSIQEHADLYRAFRGKDPDVKYLIQARGLDKIESGQ